MSILGKIIKQLSGDASAANPDVVIEQLPEDQKEFLDRLVDARMEQTQAIKSKRKHEYEAKREEFVEQLFGQAKDMSLRLQEFQDHVAERLAEWEQVMTAYGEDPNETGSYTLTAGDMRIEVKHKRQYGYDERANIAAERVKQFLGTRVKDTTTFNLIMSLLERSDDGQFDPRKIQKLYGYETDFNDQDYSKAMEFFKESYVVQKTQTYHHFKHRSDSGKWEYLPLKYTA